jgi:hypothetical protein
LYTQEFDLIRLRGEDDDSNASAIDADSGASVIVVAGHTGSAVAEVASLLLSRLSLRGSRLIKLDMSEIASLSVHEICREFRKDIAACCSGLISNAAVVVSLTVNPVVVPDFKLVIENMVPSQCRHAFSLCVVDAGAVDRFKTVLSDQLTSSEKENAHFTNDRYSFCG